jgi:hypothetical protein
MRHESHFSGRWCYHFRSWTRLTTKLKDERRIEEKCENGKSEIRMKRREEKKEDEEKWNRGNSTNSMELSPPWEAAITWVTQEFRKPLWKLKVHYLIHKSHIMVPNLSHFNPVHTTLSYVSKINFNMIHDLCLGLLSGCSLSGFTSERQLVKNWGLIVRTNGDKKKSVK